MDTWKIAELRRVKKLAPAVPLQPLTSVQAERIARMLERQRERQRAFVARIREASRAKAAERKKATPAKRSEG